MAGFPRSRSFCAGARCACGTVTMIALGTGRSGWSFFIVISSLYVGPVARQRRAFLDLPISQPQMLDDGAGEQGLFCGGERPAHTADQRQALAQATLYGELQGLPLAPHGRG